MTTDVQEPPEHQRLQALARYRLLDRSAEDTGPFGPDAPGLAGTASVGDISDEVAALTRLAAVVTGLPAAALNLFDVAHQIQLSAVGARAGVSPRAESPCAVHFLDGEVVHVADASADPRFATNPHVDGRLGSIRAYASAPLVTSDGHALGTLCVADEQVRSLSPQQVSALQDLAHVVVALFERRRQALLNARLAAEADEQRELAELLITEAGHRTRLLEAVFDSAGVGIVVTDAAGHLLTMNNTASNWLGRPLDGGLPLTEHARAYDLRTADGADTLPTGQLPLHRALHEGPVDQIEMVIVAPQGMPRAVVCSARPLHDEHGALTGAVAALHDVSILRARENALQAAHEQLTRHADQAAAVARAARSVTTAEDPRQAICEAVRDLTDARAAFLLQPHNGRLVATATSGLPEGTVLDVPLPTPATPGGAGMNEPEANGPGAAGREAREPVSDEPGADLQALEVGRPTGVPRESLAGSAYASGQFLFVADVAADPRHNTALRVACNTVSGAWQPVTLRDGHSDAHSIGVLAVVWDHPVQDMPATTRAMLSTLAGEAATTIERAALLDKLALAADHDPLTGLANRRSWDRSADREIARANRTGDPLTFLLADLDHFKAYNDTHGHLAGDELLRDFATAAAECLREVDVLARWGGEEFVMALPGCTGTDAVAIADRIRSHVPAGQSVTLGVAQWAPGQSATQLLARADQALYAGKAQGRDTTVLSPRPARPSPGHLSTA